MSEFEQAGREPLRLRVHTLRPWAGPGHGSEGLGRAEGRAERCSQGRTPSGQDRLEFPLFRFRAHSEGATGAVQHSVLRL